MRTILIAIDGSEYALRAVNYISKQFCGCDDVRITLFHVLPYIPVEFWDDGHILTEEERKARKSIVDKWLSNQTLKLDPIFGEAKTFLVNAGFREDQITTKWIPDSTDAAKSIAEEVVTGGYQTLVMGRRGHSHPKQPLGSITERDVRQGAGTTVCIVE